MSVETTIMVLQDSRMVSGDRRGSRDNIVVVVVAEETITIVLKKSCMV